MLIIPNALFSQWTPSGDYKPEEAIKRLSAENFNNMRAISSALMNYGGGDSEFDKLIQSYSEASALYFSKEYEQSAKTFQQNEKEIKEAAQALAVKYKEESGSLQKEIIQKDVKEKIIKNIKGKTVNPSANKFLEESSEAIVKGNELLSRSKPNDAIKYYRRGKAKLIDYLNFMAEQLSDEDIMKCKAEAKGKEPNDREIFNNCKANIVAERKKEISEKYAKAIADNRNKVYVSKEKSN